MKRTIHYVTFGIITVLLAVSALPAFAHTPDVSPLPIPFYSDPGVLLKAHHVNVSIENQVATTRIKQVFVNDSGVVAEGTYIFPLPVGAAVSDLLMWVNGQPVEARILDADEARRIYDEIVRRRRDPALLEYIGSGAIQASVFPIEPYGEVAIEIEYGQLLPVENALIHYEYPLQTDQFTKRPVESLSITLEVASNDPIGAIYSPTHNIAIVRDGAFHFRAGYEASYARPESAFSLFYGIDSAEINANLLTYRESADQDGFFTLMLTPPVSVDDTRVIPKDVILVLDQSGSMVGEKWAQAQEAVKFVLSHLNAQDRFNVVVFSTGVRIYANDLQPASEAPGAKAWIDGLEALGGTDINSALLRAMDMVRPERATVVLFLTDGLATEGETDTGAILDNVQMAAPSNVRLFSFGIGDDVDTILLDELYQAFRGAGAYVRTGERIDEEVSALYDKISAPVLTDITLSVDGVLVEDMYPSAPLPDLFAGSQLIITGRYRQGGDAALVLRGSLDGAEKVYRYDVSFPSHAGGQVFIPRLWATRKIGALLNAIRLHGENPELVDSIVRLSIRYGIITPYTSFLITEDDIFTQEGREEAEMTFQATSEVAMDAVSGAAAVDAAEAAMDLAGANAPVAPGVAGKEVGSGPVSSNGTRESAVRYAGDRTFVWRDGAWIDTQYDADAMTPVPVAFLSDAYFDLLALDPSVGRFLALGEHVIFVWDGVAYEVQPD